MNIIKVNNSKELINEIKKTVKNPFNKNLRFTEINNKEYKLKYNNHNKKDIFITVKKDNGKIYFNDDILLSKKVIVN